MKNEITYTHTNLVAKDWKKLVQFYTDIFGCVPVYPERDLAGDWIDKMTRIPHVRIRGMHLKLPGYERGPTLEIFEYDNASHSEHSPLIHTYGFGHIAFHVTHVEEMIEKVIAGGGSKYGDLVEQEIPGVGMLKAIYMKDPEGNIVEIQHWKKKQCG